MIHVGALPGAPVASQSLTEIEDRALREAKILRDAGVHGLMLENMHDTPYLRGAVGPEIVAPMAILARAVKEATKLPCGIQILAGANREAMAVAHSAGLNFIRVEGFAFKTRRKLGAAFFEENDGSREPMRPWKRPSS